MPRDPDFPPVSVAGGTAGQPPVIGPSTREPELISAEAALQTAETNLRNTRIRYDNAAAQRDEAVSGEYTSSDTLVQDAIIATFNEAGAALAKAEEQYAVASRQLAVTYANIAGRAQTPEQAAERRAQAQYHAAQANLANAQAQALKAKQPEDKAEAQAAVAKAQAEAQRVAAEVSQLIPAQAANLNASAQEAAARVSTLFPAQAAQAQAGAQLASAQAGQVAAETQNLLPATVRNTLAQAGYTEAQIAKIEQDMRLPRQVTGPVEGPSLAFQDPQTGAVTGQKDPRYVNPNTLLLQNQYDTLQTIQGMIERNQMSPQEGQTYMDAIRAQGEAAIQGTSLWNKTLERNRQKEAQAGIGRDMLQNRMANATSLANNLSSGLMEGAGKLTRSFDFSGINPFAMAGDFATQMGGGPEVFNTSASLIQGLQSGATNEPIIIRDSPLARAFVAQQQGGQPQPVPQPAQPSPMPVTIISPRYQRMF